MKNLTVTTYRANKNTILSVYVLCDEYFTKDEAWEKVYEAQLEGLIGDVDFVQYDDSVANYNGVKYCAVFHECED